LGSLITSCSDDESDFEGSDNLVKSFELSTGNTTYKGAITLNEITIIVPEGTFLENAKATVSISENATINPDPATVTNWNNGITFTVKSYNNSEKIYTLSVKYSPLITEGDILLATQEEVDAFTDKNINAIYGNLIIGKAVGETALDTIINLDGLTKLNYVDKTITINPTFAGEDLSGLTNLKHAGGIFINKIDSLKNVSFPSLERVDMDFYLYNSKTQKMECPKLISVGHDLTISTDSLSSVYFGALNTIGNDFSVQIINRKSVKLQTISTPQLTIVTGVLDIKNCDALESFNFPELKNIGSIAINGIGLTEKMSFPKVEMISGDVTIQGAEKLKEIAMPVLRTSGTISLKKSGNSLTVLEKLDFTSLIKAKSLILDNIAITSLDGFKSLSEISEALTIQNLKNLTSLDGLASLKSVNGTALLVNISGLNEINFKSTSFSNLRITTNTLSTVTKLSLAEIFNGDLELYINTAVTNIEGLKEINGKLTLQYVSNIENDVIVLNNLQKCAGDIRINNIKYFEAANLKEAGSLTLSKFTEEAKFPKLEKINGNFRSIMQKTEVLSFPLLEHVAGDFQLDVDEPNKMEYFDLPKLTRIDGILTIKPYGSALQYRNNTIKNLDGFESLKSVRSINIQYCNNLTSYRGLRNAIDGLNGETWSVKDCKYAPSYQDMKDGKYELK